MDVNANLYFTLIALKQVMMMVKVKEKGHNGQSFSFKLHMYVGNGEQFP